MDRETPNRGAFIDALYEHLSEGGDVPGQMSRDEFNIEYDDWGFIVAVYNMGFMAGASDERDTE